MQTPGRSHAAPLLISGALSLAACSLFPDGSVVEPAVLVEAHFTADVTAPDTVRRDVPFVVTVATIGGGCTREVARTEARPVAGGAELRLFNRRTTGNDCTADIRFVTHRAE